MSKNAKSFESFLKNKGVTPDIEQGDESTRLTIYNSIKGGPNLRILSIFDDSDEMVRLYFTDYINSVDESKKIQMYELLNKLNLEYTYIKFVMDSDNDIYATYFMTFEDNFSNEVIFYLMLSISNIMEEVYPSFMKVIWA